MPCLRRERDLRMGPTVIWLLVFALILIPLAFFVGLRQATRKPIAVRDPPTPDASVTSPAVPVEILDRIGEGVVVVNDVGTPTQANEVALTLLGLENRNLPPRLPLHELDPLVRSSLVEGKTGEAVIEVRIPDRRALSVKVVPLEEAEGAILVLRDVTQEVRTMQIRRQFVAHASHELKSPVASLQTLAEAVEQAADDDPESARALSAQMRTEAERLGRLVKGLLDLSKLEDPSAISNRSADISSIALTQLGSLHDLAARRSVRLSTDITPEITVKGDEEQLGLLVRNLLDNAIRYTPAGGNVTLEVSSDGADASIMVTDDGIGIPLRDQARIFERFYRVDDSRSRQKGGTGLGLAIVKHVAEMHGGLVTVESELGEGSTFLVVLPRQTKDG